MRAGDPILLRSCFRGRVRFALAHRFVAETPLGVALYCAPGSGGARIPRDADGRYLERWAADEPARPFVWEWAHVLRFQRPGRMDTVEVWWDPAWRHQGWYLNLQSPPEWTPLGLDTTDLALDVVVAPDGSWQWKDEDDFAELRALGLVDEEVAAAVRAAGVAAVAERAWPTGWEDWRPPPDWTPPGLPAGWDDA